MRHDSRVYSPEAGRNHLHFHDGSTCHGTPTLQMCVEEAIKNHWEGRVLEKRDRYSDNTEVRCYSLIADNFEHWAKHGRYAATLQLKMEVKFDSSFVPRMACPQCSAALVSGNGGSGVKCSECNYWFCY